MNTSTTPERLLTRGAPQTTDIENEFTAAAQDEVLARVTAAAPSGGVEVRAHRHRRWPAVAAGVAAAAALAIGVPALVPGAAPPASALDRLAQTAAAAPEVTIPDGSFQHMVVQETQNTIPLGDGAYGPGGDVYAPSAQTRTVETWTGADGTVWQRSTEADGTVGDLVFPAASVTGGAVDMSPSAVAELPTDPSALEAYLRERRQDSSSAEENVFVTIGDLLRLGYVPTEVRRAAIQVLDGLPHVSTAQATTEDGRSALRVDFADESIRPGEVFSLWFDESTASLIQETQSARNTIADETVTYLSVTTQQPEIVSEVPADVLADAEGVLVESAEG